jgi:hypothetical protein
MADREYIILRESPMESIIKDVGSVVSLSAAVWLGVYLQSTALQWIAGIIWIFVIVGAVTKYFRDNSYQTLDAARRRLEQLAAERDP